MDYCVHTCQLGDNTVTALKNVYEHLQDLIFNLEKTAAER
jgi:hypothetical protein